ncbi:ORF6N domain-containing protein [Arsenophonus sp.]|uniref:ORF6N domain-containing protein n=1 Tax=Arsenophonus sp. TaxID=1872640 RepID=UPI003879177F
MKYELITIDSNPLPIIEWKNARVVTTETLAKGYGTTEANIRVNLKNNRNRFIDGVHIFTLKDNDLRAFRNQVNNIYSVREKVLNMPPSQQ